MRRDRHRQDIPPARLRAEVADVVASGLCSGCGMCTLLDQGLTMSLDGQGYLRPRPTGEIRLTREPAAAVAALRDACPGRTIAAGPAVGPRHPQLGACVGIWEAWATDEGVRFRGSSGGVLTALAAWLVETGQVRVAVGAAASGETPTRTVPLRLTSRDEALRAAGSRYAPVGVAAAPEVLDPAAAVIGKPCEASAVRLLTGDARPLLLSFFCAGTPSQHATDHLVESLGADPPEVTELWYRGHGWPGRFTARTSTGHEVSASYDDSWGSHLGPTMQWRCKICPDGVGESADIVAADFWTADESGYPVFTDGAGRSALVARTTRGADIVRRAVEAGVLSIAEIAVQELADIQPFQVQRRRLLWWRLLGSRVAGRGVPRYRGFGLPGQAARRPREGLRMARGTLSRIRSGRAAG